MTAQELKDFLDVMRGAGLMQGFLETKDLKLSVTFAPTDLVPPEAASGPGGWKMDPRDEQDPDPLGLGNLDAPIPVDPVSEVEPE